ncbi:MAG: virulence-associated E family protein [Oscillospiraceae bacterium]|nr:virulence-associated E family protein [Oscillospiraceae bacterium]
MAQNNSQFNEQIERLVRSGMSFKEIGDYTRRGITLEELSGAVAGRIARGLPPLTDPEDEPKPTKPPLTMEDLDQYLREQEIAVCYNVITKELEVYGMPEAFNPEALGAQLHIILHDLIKDRWRCTKDQVADLLGVIAGVRRYNPVTDLLASEEWDGQDRTEELFRIMRLPPEDTLSRTLVRKWLAQGIAMSRNELRWAYGAEGMLVLTGPQGIGKTTLVKKLGMRPELYKLGQWLDGRDKDTYRRCTSAWIVELGELETSLRSDLERMKAFVTAERDEYRLPYGRADQVLARRTSLAATCNSAAFLVDPTGARRFWTVPLGERFDLEALEKLDALQLWKQAEGWQDGDPQYFRLTGEERAALAERNLRHEKPVKAQSEVEDILYEAEREPERYVWREITVSEFKAEHSALHGYSVQQIGIALDRVGICSERVWTDGKQRRLRKLPKLARTSWD